VLYQRPNKLISSVSKKNHFLPPLTTPASYLYSTTKHALPLQQNPETLHMQYDTLVQETSTKGPEQCPKIEQVYIFGENAEPASGPPPKLKKCCFGGMQVIGVTSSMASSARRRDHDMFHRSQ
jgi:hypothetical protein